MADPDLALQLHRRSSRKGLAVVYKDGLSLGPSYCSQFRYVQVLAPYYLEVAQAQGFDTNRWFVIPHLVNVRTFVPPKSREQAKMMAGMPGVTPDSCIVLAVGDFSPASNKRLAWIVQEVARLPRANRFHLILAGQASLPEFRKFEREAKLLLGDRVHLRCNLTAEEMVSLYQAADIFAHAALREPFGIVLLEALASGLPVVGHQFPVTDWIIGAGGCAIDMTSPGGLAAVLELWGREDGLRQTLGNEARRRATQTFAEEQIVPLYQQMYLRIFSERAS